MGSAVALEQAATADNASTEVSKNAGFRVPAVFAENRAFYQVSAADCDGVARARNQDARGL